ncbi:hypothetical protein KUTeg_020294 [Tegillarca granosa]|uniref:Uncharacterized protein n=1 Tax=Tegillarca granosa TaxID=220873 RepID=A0ABQ9EBP3_TEGGR|nr:hypothetical protein KUTeg_020294 [Tegillarca granosa]
MRDVTRLSRAEINSWKGTSSCANLENFLHCDKTGNGRGVDIRNLTIKCTVALISPIIDKTSVWGGMSAAYQSGMSGIIFGRPHKFLTKFSNMDTSNSCGTGDVHSLISTNHEISITLPKLDKPTSFQHRDDVNL